MANKLVKRGSIEYVPAVYGRPGQAAFCTRLPPRMSLEDFERRYRQGYFSSGSTSGGIAGGSAGNSGGSYVGDYHGIGVDRFISNFSSTRDSGGLASD